jgi:WD40 repeat protein
MRTITDAHSHFVTSLSLSANCPVLLCASVDKTISIWSCA